MTIVNVEQFTTEELHNIIIDATAELEKRHDDKLEEDYKAIKKAVQQFVWDGGTFTLSVHGVQGALHFDNFEFDYAKGNIWIEEK